MNAPQSSRPKLSTGRKLLFTGFTLLLALFLLELGFRWLGPVIGADQKAITSFQEYVRTGKAGIYERRAHTLFGHDTGTENELGFRGPEFRLEKNPGEIRISCLGGSTTYGGNLDGVEGSYPFQLEKVLEQHTGRPFEVMNWGMSGWTTAETLVNFVLNVQDFHSDVVVIHHSVNDVAPRNWPGFRRDYSHYRRSWTDLRLGLLESTLAHSQLFCWIVYGAGRRPIDVRDFVNRPPRGDYVHRQQGSFELPLATRVSFERNIRTIGRLTELDGGRVVLVTMPFSKTFEDRIHPPGIRQHNEALRRIARDEGWLLVDLEQIWDERAERTQPQFIDLCHVGLEGNRMKARAIALALYEAGLLSD